MFRILTLPPVFLIPITLLSQGISFSMEDQAVRSRIVHDVAVLASDSLQGRESGTEGERRAAGYLCAQFRAIGLLPKGTGTGSYYQEFSKFSIGYHWTTRLLVNGKPYKYRVEFGVTAISMNGHGQGILVNGLQGLVLPEREVDQLSGLGDLHGKFILVNLHVPDSLVKDTSLARKLNPRYRMKYLLNLGAQGVIFWNQDSPWFGELFDFESSDSLPGLALYVNQETAERLLQHSGAMAEVNVQLDRKKISYTNVIGYIDNRAARTIVIGAHFDHLGVKRDGKIFYGADDNGSGTAGMLELARYFATHRDSLNNFLFIGFSAEEKGLFGSEYFVRHPAVPLSSMRYMLNLDMIGRLGCNGKVVEAEAAGSSPEWRKALRDTPHPSFRLKRVGASLPYSDHYPFYQAGIPVLFFNTGLHEDYHTATDKAATLNYDGIVGITGFAEDLVGKTNRLPAIRYRKVPFISQASASVGMVFQALAWVLTIED